MGGDGRLQLLVPATHIGLFCTLPVDGHLRWA